jgi:hypothetical protein
MQLFLTAFESVPAPTRGETPSVDQPKVTYGLAQQVCAPGAGCGGRG